MAIITDPALRALLDRPDIARFAKDLAEVEPGLYSLPELGHRVAGDNRIDRSVFYTLVDALIDAGKLRSFPVWHNKTPLRCVKIEFDRLRELFGGL